MTAKRRKYTALACGLAVAAWLMLILAVLLNYTTPDPSISVQIEFERHE